MTTPLRILLAPWAPLDVDSGVSVSEVSMQGSGDPAWIYLYDISVLLTLCKRQNPFI